MPDRRPAPPATATVATATMTTLRPVAVTFVVFGTFWGGWVVAAADVVEVLDVSHGGFGVILSVALAGAAVANAVGGAVTERLGTRRVLAGALGGWALLLAGAAVAGGRWALAALLVGIIAVGGLVDVVMNVAATAGLADRPGALVRFHAGFNIGAGIGAGGMAVLLAQGASWRWGWIATGVASAVLALVIRSARLPAGDAGERLPVTGAMRLLRGEGLVLLAIAFAVGAMVEGGIELWGVLFLRTELPSGLLVGGTSAVLAYAVGAATRLTLGPAAGRRGAGRGVLLGAGTAAAGVVLLVAAPAGWLAGVGLVVAAGGISLCWPLLLAEASAGRARPGPVVGAVSAVGYLGFVVGPTVVGWVAHAVGLRGGLLILAVAALFVAAAPALAARSRPAPDAEAAGRG